MQHQNLTYTIELTKQIWDYLQYIGNPDHLFSKEKRERSQREHWMIYQSIKDRDRHLAKVLMEKHVRRISDSVEEMFHQLVLAENTLNLIHFFGRLLVEGWESLFRLEVKRMDESRPL